MKIEQPFDLEELHYTLQKGMYFSDRIEIKTGEVLYYSRYIKNSFWNYLSRISAGSVDEFAALVQQTIPVFDRINRKPAYYINRKSALFPLLSRETLSKLHLRPAFSDAWFKTSLCSRKLLYQLPIKRITSREAGEMFLNIYREGSEDAVLPNEYGEAVSRSVGLDNRRNFLHFVHTDSESAEPDAFVTVILQNTLVGLYNVGVKYQRQGTGIGTKFLESVLSRCKEFGIDYVFLQAEFGSKTEAWYKKRGFTKVCDYTCFEYDKERIK
ncbi:MAG: hypothetical protein ACLFR1_03155 [Spirochaetia bacterium]